MTDDTQKLQTFAQLLRDKMRLRQKLDRLRKRHEQTAPTQEAYQRVTTHILIAEFSLHAYE